MRAALLALLLTCGCAGPQVDLLIVGGSVIDGSGAPERRVDLAIDDGVIVAIGELGGQRARRIVDASELVVAPGFVDLHGHADLLMLSDARDALLEAKIRQGVTTLVLGNCGLGVAPADATATELLAAVNAWMTPDGVVAEPGSVADYLDRLQAAELPLHVATLVPHGPLRMSELGLEAREARPAELQRMRAKLAADLDAGAFGLSVGLIYPPGMMTPTAELEALAEVVASRDALFTAHIRGSSDRLLEAAEELLTIASVSGARVHHSHMEAVGRKHWPKLTALLQREDRARAEGLDVSHDIFPYTRAATMMVAIFPPWALEGGVPDLLERLATPETRALIRHAIAEHRDDWAWPHNLVRAVGWDGIVIASLPPDGPSDWIGRDLASLAEELGRDPFDVVADLMIASDGRVGQLVAEISGEDGLREILTHPAAMVISDAEDYGHGVPHPAHAGAFARALRWNREDRLETLARRVRRMTSMPAARIGLDRGRIEVGAVADLVLFDRERVTDRATWRKPRAYAAGIPFVFVAGRAVVDGGDYRPGGAGGVLRSRRSPS